MSQLGLGMSTAPDRSGRRGTAATVVAVLAMLCVVGILVLLGLRWFSRSPDYQGEGHGEVKVQVQAGDSVTRIGETLERSDVVRSARAFVDAASGVPEAAGIQPGTYLLRQQMGAAEALALLLDPSSRVTKKIVIPEGTRVSGTVARLAAATGIPATDFEAVLAEPEPLELPPYSGGKAEGYLFPATYEAEADATAVGLLTAMVRRFDQAADEVDLVGQAPSVGLDPGEVVIVASLLEAEGRPEDFPMIARVIYNRLEAGMRLQLDATVNYALGTSNLALTPDDLEVDSPYNTYRYEGLPPGPINSPGEAALAAALHPADGPWLYYVTVDPSTGETKFTDSYAEFLQFKAELKANTR